MRTGEGSFHLTGTFPGDVGSSHTLKGRADVVLEEKPTASYRAPELNMA